MIRIVLLVCFLIYSCTPSMPTTGPFAQSSNNTSRRASKSTYKGKVTWQLQETENHPPLSWSNNLPQDFKIYSQGDEKLVSLDFSFDVNNVLSAQQSFSVIDTSKRYSIRVQTNGANPGIELNISINGTEICNPKDFSENTCVREKIILQEENVIHVVGAKGSGVVKVELFPSSKAGEVFVPLDTQSQLVFQQLQAVKPAEGDRLLRGLVVSRLSANDKEPLLFEANTLTFLFKDYSSGVSEAQKRYGINIEDQIEIGSQRFVYALPDLDKAPVSRAQELIQEYNLKYSLDYEKMSFSSYNAWRLFLIYIDIRLNMTEWVDKLSFNAVSLFPPIAQSEVIQPNTTEELEIDDPYQGGPISGNNAFGSSSNSKRVGKNWVLRDTRTPEAWNYSLGTGAKIAWIDYGYDSGTRPIQGNLFHPDFEDRRIIIPSVSGLSIKAPDLPTVSSPVVYITPKKDGDHGSSSLQAGGAEKDNGSVGIGTAPNASLIMYQASNIKDFTKAILHALKQSPDVIGANQGFQGGRYVEGFPDLMAAMEQAVQQNVTIVWPAHNYGASITLGEINLDDPLPTVPLDPQGYSNHPVMKDMVVVGGVGLNFEPQYGSVREVLTNAGRTLNGTVESGRQIAEPYNTDKAALIHWFDKYSPPPLKIAQSCPSTVWAPGCFPYGTGFDPSDKNRLVWAPAFRHLISGTDEKGNEITKVTSGTSMSAPFVAGVIALMKSRNPSLTPAQILSILRENSFTPIQPKPTTQKAGFKTGDTKMIDVVSCVIRAIESSTQGLSTLPSEFQDNYKAKRLIGEILPNNRFLSVDEKSKGNTQGVSLRQAVSNKVWGTIRPGKKMIISGWLGNQKIKLGQTGVLPDGEMEVSFVEDLSNVVPIVESVQVFQQGVKVGGPAQPKASIALPSVVRITGKYFFDAAQKPLIMTMTGPDGARSFELGGPKDINKFFVNSDGSMVQFYLPANPKDINNRPLITTEAITEGDFSFRVNSPELGKDSNQFSPSEKIFFTRNDVSLPTPVGTPPLPEVGNNNPGGFGLKSVNPPTEEIPPGHYVFDQIGNHWIRENGRTPVETNTFAGLYFTKPIRQLTIKVGPVELPVVSVLRDLAVFGIPEDLPAGVHELTVEVDGQTLTLKDAIEKITPAVQPTSFPSPPPSGFPGLYSGARVYNVEGNDEARVFLNGQKILTVHAGEDKEVPFISNSTTGSDPVYPLDATRPNELIFEYENRGGGYSLGFALNNSSYSEQPFFHEQGKAGTKNVVNRDGTEDQTQGVVFRKRFLLHRLAYPVGSGRLWVKFFNLDDDESFTTSATYNELNDIQWDQPLKVKPGLGNEWVKGLPFPNLLMCEGQTSASYECWNSYGVNLDNFENSTGGFSFGIELYRGVNLVYHRVQGQPKGWGASDNSQQVFTPGSYQRPDQFPYQVLIPMYNNYLSGYPWWLDN